MSVHGTARFATRDELKDAGFLPNWTPGSVPDGLLVGWWRESPYDFAPITYKGDLHQLIIGGIGGGKFTTALAPLLLGSGLEDQTVVVVDPKGEIAKLAGPFFQEPFGKERTVFVLDPWNECGIGATATLNVLSQLRLDNPNCVDDARALADGMVIPSGNENTHWDQAARNFLAALLLYVALDPREKERRDLVRVRELVALPWAMPKTYAGPPRQALSTLLYSYLDNELADGAIKHGFAGMLNREEKERSGIISSLERETTWIDSPPMKKVLRGEPGIDLKRAALEGGKYFVVLPATYFNTHRAWLRLCITAFASAFKQHKRPQDRPLDKRWRHIVIDEFPMLGEMSSVLNDVAMARGYEVKYHFAIQDLPQLRRIYNEGWETFINTSFQRVFAVSDLFTTDYISRMLGSSTVEAMGRSVGSSFSSGYSRNIGTGRNEGSSSPSAWTARGAGSTSSGTNYSEGENWSESSSQSSSFSYNPTQRALRTADEVRRLPDADEFLIFRGMHPVQCWRPPYWTIFPSLPDFTLKEVLDTVGRKPTSAAERKRFTAWRKSELLMKPEPLPPPVIEGPDEVPRLPAPEPSVDWRIKAGALGFAALLVIYWAWPSAPPPPVVRPRAPAPIVKAEIPKQDPAPAPIIRPREPPPPARVRLAVPGQGAVRDAHGGVETRDYLLTAAREQVNLCSPAHAAEERKLIGYLVDSARNKQGALMTGNPEARMARETRFRQLLDDYLGKPDWTRAQREEVFELIVRAVQEHYGTLPMQQATARALDRLYANNACPFGAVTEGEYLPPNYGGTRVPVAQN